jgi:hypothetical protein
MEKMSTSFKKGSGRNGRLISTSPNAMSIPRHQRHVSIID